MVNEHRQVPNLGDSFPPRHQEATGTGIRRQLAIIEIVLEA
jgi:hypothetical protein